MADCLFCRIVTKRADAVILCEDADLIAFLDIAPIRIGHSHIVPKVHYETFDVIPRPLAGRIVALGQDLARRMKTAYGVERVAFLFTGGDVPHAHAHVVPMHEKTDVTSARYIVSPPALRWSVDHLRVDRAELLAARRELGFPEP